MNKIIDYIAQETDGNAFKSHRFCFDKEFNLPSLVYDDNSSFTILKEYGENAPEKKPKSMVSLAKKITLDKPLFQYFLDGSRRIYKIDDIEYQKRIFPVVGGQIGVACCERIDINTFSKAFTESHLVLSIPRAATAAQRHETQFIGNLLQKINNFDKIKKFNLTISDLLIYKPDKSEDGVEEYINRATAKVQDKMIEYEKKVVEELVRKNLLNIDNYLMKDGSLQYQKTSGNDFRELSKYKANYRRVVGVSKSFNPELSQDSRGKSNAAEIAKLPLFHRTPAAKFTSDGRIGDVKFAIWYVRIRDAGFSDSPFSGVLKMEKVLVTDEEIEEGLDSGEIDRITANILNERNPVCYGRDHRWANHLYPIFLTESYIKTKFLSDLHFINLF